MTMAALQSCSILKQSISSVQSGFVEKRYLKSGCQEFLKKSNVSLWSPRITRISPRSRGAWRAEVGGEQSDGAQEIERATTVAPGESKLGGAKGFGAPPKTALTDKKKVSKSSFSSSSVRRPPPSKPLIGIQPVNQQTQQIETAVVASLGILFVVILLEGLVLAGSGFLPEEWDEIVVKILYPAFTPSVGVFLAIAAGYGLWKYLGGGSAPSKK